MIGTGSYKVHVWVERNYAGEVWYWEVEETHRPGILVGLGGGRSRRDAKKNAENFCHNHAKGPQEDPDDFTFTVMTAKK